MREYGFRYAGYKKSYYVDRHEDPDVVLSCEVYVKQNFQDEVDEKCWIQLPVVLYHNIMRREESVGNVEKFVRSKAFFYIDNNNSQYVEVNIHDLSSDTATDLPAVALSVRNKTGVELVTFGQDKCIFRSSHLNDNVWYIDGKTTLRKKGMGSGIMVSAFTSYKFGFAWI